MGLGKLQACPFPDVIFPPLFCLFVFLSALSWAVGRSSKPVREGIRHSRPPTMSPTYGWNRWCQNGITGRIPSVVRGLGPDGQKGSMTISTATCSSWRGVGFVRLYLAVVSPWHDTKLFCSLSVFFTTVLFQWDFSHRKFGLPSLGKASCDRVALPNLRCMLCVLVLP